MFAAKARKSVENSRLMLDSTKASKKSAVMARGMNPDDEGTLSEEARAEIEAAEDEFVSQTEEAVGVMKNVGLGRLSASLLLLTRFARSLTRPSRSATLQT